MSRVPRRKHDGPTETRSNDIGDGGVTVYSALRVGKRIEETIEPGTRTVDSSYERGTDWSRQ